MLAFETMTEALNELYLDGYTYDFNLVTLATYNSHRHLPIRDFVIVHVFRFENNSDPSESAILYAIGSELHQIKGTLVNGYGIYADALTNRFINSIGSQEGVI